LDDAYRRSLLERTKKRIAAAAADKDQDDCWPWPGKINTQGYGKVWNKNAPGKEELAHRMMYEASYGALAHGLCVLHTCNNPRCCNPRHLRAGTRTENAAQRDAEKRHHHGEAHYASIVSASDVREIRTLHRAGSSIKELAAKYKITYKHAWKITAHHIWKDA
jgi:hypothetical protein